jgi:ADP-ribosylation factor-binding protein GGA
VNQNSLDTFLQINDQINTVLDRYDAFVQGDYTTSSNPIPPEYGTTDRGAPSLIDLDDETSPERSSQTTTDSLASLFDSISPSTTPMSATAVSPTPTTRTGIGVGVRGTGSVSPSQQVGAIVLPGTPKPNLPHSTPVMGQTPMGSQRMPPGQTVTLGGQESAPAQERAKDPFADLIGLF